MALIYKSSVAWNKTRNLTGIFEAKASISTLEEKLKKLLLDKQFLGDLFQWIEDNFITVER